MYTIAKRHILWPLLRGKSLIHRSFSIKPGSPFVLPYRYIYLYGNAYYGWHQAQLRLRLATSTLRLFHRPRIRRRVHGETPATPHPVRSCKGTFGLPPNALQPEADTNLDSNSEVRQRSTISPSSRNTLAPISQITPPCQAFARELRHPASSANPAAFCMQLPPSMPHLKHVRFHPSFGRRLLLGLHLLFNNLFPFF